MSNQNMPTLLGMPSVPNPVMAEDNRSLFQRGKRVVILGGGFAGVYTAKYLTQMQRSSDRLHVELLSADNYFVFQPLLPEVAAGGVGATSAVSPIRELIPGVRFRACKVQSIDFTKRHVLVTQGDGLRPVAVGYDHLVFCLGKVANFASMPGVEEHAMVMKDTADAFALRNQVIRCLELADIEGDPLVRQSLLTFVVAGGGFSGVETIGELGELIARSLRYFPRIRKQDIQLKLVHAMPELLPEMHPKLRAAAARILTRRGIELVLNDRVRAASPERVYLTSGRTLYARTFVSTVGNTTNPVIRHALAAGGLTEAENGGRKSGLIATDMHLRCIGTSDYWAVGDCAGVPHPSGKGLCPPTAQFAIRQAQTCATNILMIIRGKELRPLRFKGLGSLASLGMRQAVADLMGIKMSGLLAWFAWRAIYLMKFPGFGRKLRIALDWLLDLFFPRDLTQLSVARRSRLKVHHYEPGERIIQQGQIGREVFIIKSGEVEVVKLQDDGTTERVLQRHGPKEIFGERALLEDTERSASVRSVTAVDVLVMSRDDFKALVASFPVLKEYFASQLPGV